ncbi:MAG TPA: TatD family hydrolase, partial [Anaerolineales bacterium]|nr:TatD family hydrolase [Anaerolineales bacterium]
WIKEPEKRMEQRQNLLPHLELAKQVNKPVILHLREENDAWFGAASVDLLNILADWQKDLSGALADKPGVLHSFNGTLETAQKALALNFYIGITGPITYKKADRKREIVAQLPLEKLLIETDSPFLAPAPFRGKRNEPANVGLIADKIAEVHRMTREAVAQITTANANRLFGWEAYA